MVLSVFSPFSLSKCQSGSSVTFKERLRVSKKAFVFSLAKTSEGPMRVSASLSASRGTFVAQNFPFVNVSQTRAASPVFSFGSVRESRTESDFSFKSALSVNVPGVTIRTTRRSIIAPLSAPIASTCSEIATDSPLFTRRARYCSSVEAGIPAIGIGFPSKVPRRVSVSPKIRETFTASSKKVS